MNRISLSILFFLSALIASGQSLRVLVKQDGKVIEAVDNVYKLQKTPFQFEISATDVEGFLLGVTTDENHFGEAVDFFEPDEPWFQNTGMAEVFFNQNKELYLMDMAPSYWYYTDENDHRFDRNPKGTAKQWQGTRTITRLYDITADQVVELKDIEVSLYIYMFDPIYNDDYDMVGKKSLFFGELKFGN
ncbi:hypothetical protein [Sphingobacterium sp. LRF_L2]|uniref:hypothetical protein n=1 Tax=Sphingobacterium sp. LRF_L2 TaxID=3369421 RepID=UPI003F618CE0